MTTKPLKKIVLSTQHNAFSPVVNYVATGKMVKRELRLEYRNLSDSSYEHAFRMAGKSAEFREVEHESYSFGSKIRYIFVFEVLERELKRV